MIVKMSFVSIAGHKEDIDRIIDTYLSKYEIQLENALVQLKSSENLLPYVEANPYKDLLSRSRSLVEMIAGACDKPLIDMSLDTATSVIDSADLKINDFKNHINALENKRTLLQSDYELLEPFKSLDYNLKDISDMEYISYNFGRIPRDHWDNFSSFLKDDKNFIFINCRMDSSFVYGAYFSTAALTDKVKKVFDDLRFEKIKVPDKYNSSPTVACLQITQEIASVNDEIHQTEEKISEYLETQKVNILSACDRIELEYVNFYVRKMAACTRNGEVNFHVLCGWRAADDAKRLLAETENDPDVICIVDDDFSSTDQAPPIKLKNPKPFKPFEMFVKMYGLPAYDEFDPTIFLSITYALIFGVMFGDLGQGLCLLVGGLLLYKFKKMDLAAIIAAAGFFSSIFGILFGSFFGFEDIIPALWLRPLEAISSLPFLGNINTILVVAFCFGAFMILTTMILNIVSAIKAKDYGRMLFGPNSVTGFIFYGSLIAVIVLYMTGHSLPGTVVLVVMFVIPLILIFFEEPLKNIIAKKKPIEDSIGIFFATAFFELFEYLLTYFSNSMSFLRIGVFAISHAAMMEVVLTLAGAENGSANIFVIIIGNIIVLGMEGLVVGIQVLRLEYYELFGRFYKGSGREFTPYSKKTKQ